MTLQEWLDAHPDVSSVRHNLTTKPSVQVFTATGDHDLFHLSDYYVSSALSGPSYWLVARDGER